MMGTVIGLVLPFAVGIALSPIPIAAVILMSLSLHPHAGGGAFVAGWALGLVVASMVLLIAAGLLGVGAAAPVAWLGPARIVLGALLLVFAWERAAAGHARVSEAGPAWVAGLDRLPVDRALAVGAVQAGLDPRKLVMVAAMVLTIAESHLGSTELVLAIIVFVAIGSIGVALALVSPRLGGVVARARLEAVRARLVDDNTTIQAVTLLLLGALLVGQGLTAL